MFLHFVILVLFASYVGVDATLTPKSRKDKTDDLKIGKIKTGPQNSTVNDRNLVTEATSLKEILQNHKAYFHEIDNYEFDGMVLGYVTPWNNEGYNMAKIFGNKFTHISPVWLEMKRSEDFELGGTHDIDRKWMVHIRNAGRQRKLKIVPRILFGSLGQEAMNDLLINPKVTKKMIALLIKTAKAYTFDGYVIELWPHVQMDIDYQPLINLVRTIGDSLALEGLELILVIPPKRGRNIPFSNQHFDELYEHVTAFSLMTYDYSHPSRPGPNAPISWVEDCINTTSRDQQKRSKILTGFNFYGNHYKISGGEPIIGRDYVKILEEKLKNCKMVYDQETVEHYIEYEESGRKYLIFYPTLYSIKRRIDLCRSLGTGISIWELGQGLPYFYDLI